MANSAVQSLHFYNQANVNIYNGEARRDVELYPLTAAGQAAYEAAVALGTFTITVDNGAIISPGTVPPLTKPIPPPSVAFATQIEAEAMAGNTTMSTYQGITIAGPFTAATDFRQASLQIVGLKPCTITYRYQVNNTTPGRGTIVINEGTFIDFNVAGSNGIPQTASIAFVPIDGNNSIRFQGKDGTSFYLDFIIVSRTA